MIMEKKRKISEAETVENENSLSVKKKKKELHRKKDSASNNDNPISENKIKLTDSEIDESEKFPIKKKQQKRNPENTSKNLEDNHEDVKPNESQLFNTPSEENDLKKVKKKKQKIEKENKEKVENNAMEISENNDESVTNVSKESGEIDGDGINTPTTKKPPRKSGETKKQYKRRMKALREAGLLIDPPVVEGVKKDKKNRKTRKEKRAAKQKKNEELEKFRSIVQINYLKAWKSDPSKWKFNKNVQGKIIKHMFDTSRISQDIFEILIEYIMGTNKSTKMYEDINKKCSQVVEAMEKWTSADDEEKKTLTEPDKEVYERARQVLQSLA